MKFKIFTLVLVPATICIFFSSCKKVLPPEPVGPIPSPAQLVWHEMEMNVFVHLTTNTFTGLEWGMGNESPSVFNPSGLNTDQWLSIFKETGFSGLILVCKHHDGFCLWPSNYTAHSVRNSPYKNGTGDVVKEVADACKRYGLKFGIYLSPWDRNHDAYGSPEYIKYYRNQLNELLTNYGPVFEMWFDGANGGEGYYGGASEARTIDASTYYDWPRTIDFVKSIQPDVIFFSDAGPDIRWCGNEKGIVGSTNWCTITPDTLYAGKRGTEKLLNSGSEDGTRWIPAEADVSIRPGWFYHEREDSLVKTPEDLFEIYLKSVGRGSNLLLSIPPDKRGLIHNNDIESLKGFKEILEREFKTNLALRAKAGASSYRGNSDHYNASSAIDGNIETYWATDDGLTKASLELTFNNKQIVKYVIIQEYIKLGQRVKKFNIEISEGDTWVRVAEATTIGYKRIIRLDPSETDKIKINITSAKACPVISNVEIY